VAKQKKKKETKAKYEEKLYPITKQKARVKVQQFFYGGSRKMHSENFHIYIWGFSPLCFICFGVPLLVQSLLNVCPASPTSCFYFFFEAAAALCGCLKQLTGPTDRLMYVDSAFSLLFPS